MSIFRYIDKGGLPKRQSGQCECVIIWNDEPPVPYHLVKISIIKTENRYDWQRTDPASRRKAKVKAIKTAIMDLWKALKNK